MYCIEAVPCFSLSKCPPLDQHSQLNNKIKIITPRHHRKGVFSFGSISVMVILS